jgi:hypothetical protein
MKNGVDPFILDWDVLSNLAWAYFSLVFWVQWLELIKISSAITL